MLSHETIWLFQLVHVAAAVFSFISACMGLTRYLNILDILDIFRYTCWRRDKWDIPWNTIKERSITITYNALENTVASTISATHVWCMMGRFAAIPSTIQQPSCILLGSILLWTCLSYFPGSYLLPSPPVPLP